MSEPSNPKMAAVEAMESLTGYDEAAIAKHFGKEFEDLGGRATVRALIFILEKRGGADEPAAMKTAMSITGGQLDDYFEPEQHEVMPEEPDTEQGKDASETA